MSSLIMLCIFSITFAILSFYNAKKCNEQIKKVRKYGHIQKSKIISYQKRKAPTSASGRYTTITWHDITVKIEILDKYITQYLQQILGRVNIKKDQMPMLLFFFLMNILQ